MIKKITTIGLIFTLCFSLSSSQDKKVIKIGNKKIKVEIADTPEVRKKGLMERKYLAPNEGMLFIFEESDYHSFWMKNTLIPLSIAFISEEKKVLEIRDMQPLNETTIYRPLYPIRYALEMNKNWFKKNKIKPGAKFIFLK